MFFNFLVLSSLSKMDIQSPNFIENHLLSFRSLQMNGYITQTVKMRMFELSTRFIK